MNFKSYLLLLSFILSTTLSFAQTIAIQPLGTNFDRPVSIAHAGDDRLFIVEQEGRIQILQADGTVNDTPFLDIENKITDNGNEQGLLGLAFHPDYQSNGFFFVNYTATGGGDTKIARYSVSDDPDIADPDSETIFMSIEQPFGNHNGGAVEFGPDGYLYIGTGDGGSANDPFGYGQDPQSLLAKMLRINVDDFPYTIPADNPFVDNPDVLDEIWATGIRNPWRYTFDRMTGDLWIGDVGQNELEEIDFQPADSPGGENYGWNCYEGTEPFQTDGCTSIYIDPVFEYLHSLGCSVAGGYVYRGARYAGLWGHYLFTDLCSGRFWSTVQNEDGTFETNELEVFDNKTFSVFGENACGDVFMAELNSGQIYEIVETANCEPMALILNNESTGCPGEVALEAICSEGLSYLWFKDGVALTEATNSIFEVLETGSYTVEVDNGTCAALSEPFLFTVFETEAPDIIGLDELYCQGIGILYPEYDPTGGILTGPGADPEDNSFNAEVAGLGIHELTYTYMTADGCSSSTTQMVEVALCSAVNLPTNTELSIYPNPSKGLFFIEGIEEPITKIQIFNINGQQCFAKIISTTEQQLQLANMHLSNGLYIVEIHTITNISKLLHTVIND